MTVAAPAITDPHLLLADRLQRRWGGLDDRSFDPYDGLAGARLPRIVGGIRLGRLAVVHLHRRSPVNMRALFGIPPTKSAYTVGHFASACLVIAELTGSAPALAGARRRLEWLRSVRVGGAWTYPFDVQTRTFHYSRATPNVVCTAFAANAFLDAAEGPDDGADAALDVALDAARFARDELRVRRPEGTYFGYLPNDEALIHNGNLLAARLVIRAGVLADDDGLVDIGLEALPPTLRAVAPDGSIPYGAGGSLGWVDGHHTGFVIESLADIDHLVPAAGLASVVAPMAEYYRDRLFGADGQARSRPGTSYPVDALAAAQGIQTFAKLGGDHVALARRIARSTLEGMAGSGGFLYQRHRFHAKAVPYVRWADAPMCLALAELARSSTEPGYAPERRAGYVPERRTGP